MLLAFYVSQRLEWRNALRRKLFALQRVTESSAVKRLLNKLVEDEATNIHLLHQFLDNLCHTNQDTPSNNKLTKDEITASAKLLLGDNTGEHSCNASSGGA